MPSTCTCFVASVPALVGLVLVTVGVVTPNWTMSKMDNRSLGVWASEGFVYTYENRLYSHKPTSFVVCELFGVLSIVAGVVCCGSFVIFSVMNHLNKCPYVNLMRIARFAALLAVKCVLITTIRWARSNYSYYIGVYLGYSFVLTACGGGLLLIFVFITLAIKDTYQYAGLSIKA